MQIYTISMYKIKRQVRVSVTRSLERMLSFISFPRTYIFNLYTRVNRNLPLLCYLTRHSV